MIIISFHLESRNQVNKTIQNNGLANGCLADFCLHMLKYREEYVDPGATYYEEQYRKRAIKNLERKATRLGMKVVPDTTSVCRNVS